MERSFAPGFEFESFFARHCHCRQLAFHIFEFQKRIRRQHIAAGWSWFGRRVPVGRRGRSEKSQKFLSPQPVLYGTGPMRPDRSAMPARPPNGPRPASQPCTGKGILSRKPPTQTRETRTDSRVVEDESPRRRFRRDDQVSPVPPPRPTRRLGPQTGMCKLAAGAISMGQCPWFALAYS